MWTYQAVLNVGIQILLLMALGWLFARFKLIQQSAFLPPMNYLVLNLALPAFNLYLMGIKLDLQDPEAWKSLAAFLLWVFSSQGAILLYSWLFCGGDAGEASVLNMVLIMDNFGIVGLLVLNATLGNKWGPLSLLITMGFFLTIFPFSLTAFEWEKWAVAAHVKVAAAAAAAVDIEVAANTAAEAPSEREERGDYGGGGGGVHDRGSGGEGRELMVSLHPPPHGPDVPGSQSPPPPAQLSRRSGGPVPVPLGQGHGQGQGQGQGQGRGREEGLLPHGTYVPPSPAGTAAHLPTAAGGGGGTVVSPFQASAASGWPGSDGAVGGSWARTSQPPSAAASVGPKQLAGSSALSPTAGAAGSTATAAAGRRGSSMLGNVLDRLAVAGSGGLPAGLLDEVAAAAGSGGGAAPSADGGQPVSLKDLEFALTHQLHGGTATQLARVSRTYTAAAAAAATGVGGGGTPPQSGAGGGDGGGGAAAAKGGDGGVGGGGGEPAPLKPRMGPSPLAITASSAAAGGGSGVGGGDGSGAARPMSGLLPLPPPLPLPLLPHRLPSGAPDPALPRSTAPTSLPLLLPPLPASGSADPCANTTTSETDMFAASPSNGPSSAPLFSFGRSAAPPTVAANTAFGSISAAAGRGDLGAAVNCHHGAGNGGGGGVGGGGGGVGGGGGGGVDPMGRVVHHVAAAGLALGDAGPKTGDTSTRGGGHLLDSPPTNPNDPTNPNGAPDTNGLLARVTTVIAGLGALPPMDTLGSDGGALLLLSAGDDSGGGGGGPSSSRVDSAAAAAAADKRFVREATKEMLRRHGGLAGALRAFVSGHPQLFHILIILAKNPMIWTMFLALAVSVTGLRVFLDPVSPRYLPELGWVAGVLAWVNGLTVPLTIFSNGAWMYGKRLLLKGDGPKLAAIMALKVGLLPLLMVGCTLLVGLEGQLVASLTLLTLCPTAATGFVLAMQYGRGVELVTITNILGSILLTPLVILWVEILTALKINFVLHDDVLVGTR